MKDLERRHGGYCIAASNGGLRVDVDLSEGNLVGFRVLFREAFKVRSNHFAGTAPVGVDYG